MKKREKLILQAILGLLVGLSLIKQDEYYKKLALNQNVAIKMKYCNAINVDYEEKGYFTKILSKKCNKSSTVDEWLTKSKREKIVVMEKK